MHILNIDTGSGKLQHLCLRLKWPVLDAKGDAADIQRKRGFIEVLLGGSGLWNALPLAGMALRIIVRPGQPLVTVHSFTASHSEPVMLGRIAASFMRLDGMVGAEIDAPLSLQDYETTFAPSCGEWFSVDGTPLQIMGDQTLTIDRTMFVALNDMFRQAQSADMTLEYAMVACAASPDPALLRHQRKLVAALARHDHVSPALVQQQQMLNSRLSAATHHCFEAIAADEATTHMLATRSLTAPFAADTQLWNARPVLVPVTQGVAAALENHIHPSLIEEAPRPDFDVEAIGGFQDNASLAAVLNAEPLWKGRAAGTDPLAPLDMPVARIMAAPVAPPGVRGTTAPDVPPAAEGPVPSDFLFVSYAHRDRTLIQPMLAGLKDAGVQTWIDDSLDAGDEWDERLERQIVNCAGLLAFVTDAYAHSKVCRREIKFADALGKPIFASRLTNAALHGGLGLLFASLQFVSPDRGNVVELLIRAISSGAPHALAKRRAHL